MPYQQVPAVQADHQTAVQHVNTSAGSWLVTPVRRSFACLHTGNVLMLLLQQQLSERNPAFAEHYQLL